MQQVAPSPRTTRRRVPSTRRRGVWVVVHYPPYGYGPERAVQHYYSRAAAQAGRLAAEALLAMHRLCGEVAVVGPDGQWDDAEE